MISYKRYKLIAPLVVATASLFWMANTTFMREGDYKRYCAFKQKQHEIDNSSKLVSQNAFQTREKVCKDIWRAEPLETNRLHYRIESGSSVLKLVPGEHKAELVETLKDIKCWMQDKLVTVPGEPPYQQVRYFEAGQGVYLYHSQKFNANSVAISLMRLPGHELTYDSGPKNAFLRGNAKNVSFSVTEGSPQLQAQNFKASIKGGDL